MFKLFHKKLNKKGFTLAELLIVVAIIAVLVAIAIPIYTGLLERAQVGVNTANARSVKGAAVATILGDWDALQYGTILDKTTATTTTVDANHPHNGWLASGYVDKDGEIAAIHVYMAVQSFDADKNPDFIRGVVYHSSPADPDDGAYGKNHDPIARTNNAKD